MRRDGSRNAYFNQRIPADVRRLAVGRRIDLPLGDGAVSVAVGEHAQSIRFSLRTADPAEVKVRTALAAAALERYWRALRQAAPASLSHRQCVALAGNAYRAWASVHPPQESTVGMVRVPAAAAAPGEPVREWRWEADNHPMDGVAGLWEAAGKSLSEDALGPLAERLLLAEGIGSVDEPSREMLLAEIRAALAQAFEARERMAQGDYRRDTDADRFPAFEAEEATTSSSPARSRSRKPAAAPSSLSAILDDWWREAKAGGRALSTYESYASTIARLRKFLGHDDAVRVSAEDVVAFKDHRLAQGVSVKTVRDSDLACLRSIFGWAVSNRRMASDPAQGVRLRAARTVRLRDRDLTPDEAAAALRHAMAYRPKSKHEAAKTSAAKRWIPWLCAYSGARVGELAQLRKQDVRRMDDGVCVITITPDAGTVKDKERREVVLHAHLIEQGFMDFVDQSRDGYLFFNAEVRASGDSSDYSRGVRRALKNRLASFVREVVTDKGVAPLHGMRHTFKTIGREAGIADSVLDAICGHKPSSVGGRYGSITIATQVQAFNRFPRFAVGLTPCSPKTIA